MLDDLDTLRARDENGFLPRLAALPGAYQGPDAACAPPFGLDASGPATALLPVVAAWTDARLVGHGTQFLVDEGFDAQADLALRGVAAEAADPAVVWIVHGDEEAEQGTDLDVRTAVVRLPAGPFAPFHQARFLAFATGRPDTGERLARALRAVADAADPSRDTAVNPAKTLAWALWQRVPLLVSDPAGAPAQVLVQQAFARVGKTLAIASGPHGALVAAAAFEGRHPLADDLVALVLGHRGRETDLVEEVLATRVAQVERLAFDDGWLPAADGDPVVDALVLWYAALWVAAYGALLAGLDPADEDLYGRVRAVA